MHLVILPNYTLLFTQIFFFFQKPLSMFLVFGLSIMFNTIGGQPDERLNAFIATCSVVNYILYVITCDSCGE